MTALFIFLAILLFSILIFVHELGHFITAKLSGVQVNEFSLFMGPAIFKKQKGETLYALRCIPIGGYCAMEGEDTASDNPRSFQNAAWWKRLIILVAGSAMNLIFGFLLAVLLFAPEEIIVLPSIESATQQCTVVREDGLHVGDRFLEIDGKKIYTSSNVTTFVQLAGFECDVLVERNGEQVLLEDFTFETYEETDPETGTVIRRFGFNLNTEPTTFPGLLAYAWNFTLDNIRMVPLSLQMLFTGEASVQSMMGPVGVIRLMTESATSANTFLAGLQNIVYFGAFLAVNLGVMNLLPIPALDGGRVVGLLLTTGVEKITGKKINPKIEGYIHGGFMVLLLILMVLILFKDIFFFGR